MEPKEFTKIINQKRYSTLTAKLIASDAYWDGHNWERQGRNTYLYRTKKGSYFLVRQTRWQGERDVLEPISQDEACSLYEGNLITHEVSYEAAFPGLIVEDA